MRGWGRDGCHFADHQILEEHLAVEATVDASHADVTRLAALNDSSCHFLEAIVC